jgi:hypothetical protein
MEVHVNQWIMYTTSEPMAPSICDDPSQISVPNTSNPPVVMPRKNSITEEDIEKLHAKYGRVGKLSTRARVASVRELARNIEGDLYKFVIEIRYRELYAITKRF